MLDSSLSLDSVVEDAAIPPSVEFEFSSEDDALDDGDSDDSVVGRLVNSS